MIASADAAAYGVARDCWLFSLARVSSYILSLSLSPPSSDPTCTETADEDMPAGCHGDEVSGRAEVCPS